MSFKDRQASLSVIVFCSPAQEKEMLLLSPRPRGYKTFFMLNSFEHEILNAPKYKDIKKFGFFKAQINLECYFSRS